MAMNIFMHPRNIYKTPPDFTQLAIDYPEFRAISTLDINGKVKVDFKDIRTLQALTRCLLRKDFDLDVCLPADKLIPTLPLRLNYILWLEDILSVAGFNRNIVGIDIGCGASCIYPLLAARRNSWHLFALESNSESLEHARQNVVQNKLELNITVLQQPNESVIFEKLCATAAFESADFCMCNPPFFSGPEELEANRNNRSGHRPEPKNSVTGASDELMATGGECEFVEKIIAESQRLRDRIRVYTTMLGHKSSVQRILQTLARADITNVATTEFCQGQTTRWGIAWSYVASILLRTVPTYGARPAKKKLFIFNVPVAIDGQVAGVSDVQIKLERLFVGIGLRLEGVVHSSGVVKSRMVAMHNTWSKQRRKRREIERLAVPQFENQVNTDFESLYMANEGNGPPSKRPRLDDTSIDRPPLPVLVMGVTICKHSTNGVAVNLEYLNGSSNRDGVYQVLQFIRNHWK